MPATLELNTEYKNANRFPGWIALFVFSVVCVASITSRYEDKDGRSSDVKWCLTVSVISMLISIASVIAYLVVRELYCGQAPEAAAVALCLGFWGAGLPVIQNPNNDIAHGNVDVINANLYFFSWLAFAATIFLVGHFLQQELGFDMRTMTPEKAPRWYGLTASSLVVMGSAIRTYKDVNCGEGEFAYYDSNVSEDTFCRRCKLAISFGVIGFFAAASMTFATHLGLTDAMLDIVITALLFVMWCFGVGFITFGDSPGTNIGNLYFSSWISFIIIVVLFANAFREFITGAPVAPSSGQESGVEATSPTHSNGGDFGESYGQTSYPSPPRHPEIPSEDDI